MLSMRKSLALVLAGSMALAAGCGGTKSGSNTNNPAPDAPKAAVKVEFWHGMNPESAHGKVLNEMIAEFNKSQSNVIIEGSYHGSYSDLEKKLTGAIAAKTAPTIVQNTDSMLTNLVRARAVKELDALVPASDKADYGDGLLTAQTFDGKLYALPFNKSMIVLIYDKALIANPPKNWDEFHATAKQVTGTNKNGTAFPADVYYFGQHFVQAGGEWIKNGEAAFNSEAGVQALQLIVDMAKDGSAVQLKPNEYASNYFNEGRAAMIATTSASFAFINPIAGVETGIAPLYAGPKNDNVPLSGANLSIVASASDEQTKAAMEFLLWATGKEGTLMWATGKTGYMPVRKSALADSRWTNFVAANPEYKVLGDSISKGVTQPNHPQWQAIQKEITTAIESAVLGRATPKAALDEAAKKANDLLKK